MSKGTFVKLHHQILEWEWYSNPNTFRLFIHLLLKAYRKPSTWRGLKIGVGQVVTGLEQLSLETGLSYQQVRTCLNNMISTGEITRKTSKLGSIITIVKYKEFHLYQQDNNKKTNSEITTIPTTILENRDKENKEKNIKKRNVSFSTYLKEHKLDKQSFTDKVIESDKNKLYTRSEIEKMFETMYDQSEMNAKYKYVDWVRVCKNWLGNRKGKAKKKTGAGESWLIQQDN